ncbi:MAG: GNAT family N-acetyltransferase [Actinobacteria bacterium]|uniref:Unannotated protein n=1 Tax=freshwater metagenome TaxID=449393 RepID=A0A6J6NXQ9_9ZZZZ|nr:GNAT family N-acetyltransferase [Actinomycetota bacterium]
MSAPQPGVQPGVQPRVRPSVTLRRAVADDSPVLVALHLDCWDDAYTGLIDQQILDARRADEPARVERWRGILDQGTTLVAEDASGMVGFVCAADADPPEVEGHTELQSLYVRGSHWGTGVGHQLLVAAIADRPAYLWVLEGNERAIEFYRRHSFLLDGMVTVEREGRHLRMVRS